MALAMARSRGKLLPFHLELACDVATTKHERPAVLMLGRDHSIADGLEYVAAWNSAQLVSADYAEVFSAMKEKRRPVFLSKM